MKAIKQLFFLPPTAMIVVMVIALVRPAAIFGGIHYGGILGIFIPVIVIMIGIIFWFYVTKMDFPHDNVLYFVVTLGCYALAIVTMIIGIATLPKRDIYIRTPTELGVIAHLSGSSNNFYLEDDVDFNGKAPGWCGKLNEFHGVIDGDGHKILNITFNGSGIFAKQNFGTIKNLSIVNAKFFANRERLAIVNSDAAAGMIVGFNYGDINNIQVLNSHLLWKNYDISDYDVKYCYLGGIIGFNDGGKVENCEYYCGDSNDNWPYSISIEVKSRWIGTN